MLGRRAPKPRDKLLGYDGDVMKYGEREPNRSFIEEDTVPFLEKWVWKEKGRRPLQLC